MRDNRFMLIAMFLIFFAIGLSVTHDVSKTKEDKKEVCSMVYINPEEGIISIEDCALEYDLTITIDGIEYIIEGQKKVIE